MLCMQVGQGWMFTVHACNSWSDVRSIISFRGGGFGALSRVVWIIRLLWVGEASWLFIIRYCYVFVFGLFIEVEKLFEKDAYQVLSSM
jgi:hypothetical protein